MCTIQQPITMPASRLLDTIRQQVLDIILLYIITFIILTRLDSAIVAATRTNKGDECINFL